MNNKGKLTDVEAASWQVSPEYQHLMDFVFWSQEYASRAEIGVPVDERRGLIKYNLGPLIYPNDIITHLLEGKPLYNHLGTSSSLAEELWGATVRSFGVPLPSEDKPISVPARYDSEEILISMLRDIGKKRDELLKELINKTEKKESTSRVEEVEYLDKMLIVAIDFRSPLDKILKIVEGMWISRNQKIIDGMVVALSTVGGNKRMSGANMSRAVGLWLWDEMASGSSITQAEAIRKFSDTYELEELGMDKTTESDLRFYLRITNKCIEKNEVLPFSKKGTR